MAQWVNHVVLSLPRNGTTTHTIDPSNATGGGTVVAGTAFTPTAGRFLLIVIAGAVTSTTPTSWTLPTNGSALSGTGLYVWYRASAAGSDTMSTTHNGSNYSVAVDVYEFPAGTTFVAAATGNNLANATANPSVSAGAHTLLAAAVNMSQFGGTIATGVSWSGTPTPTKVADVSIVPSGTDGTYLSTAYADDTGASTYAPTATYSGPFSEKEALTWSLSVPSGSAFSGSAAFTATATLSTVSATPTARPSATLSASASLTASRTPAIPATATFSPTAGLTPATSVPSATSAAAPSVAATLTAAAAPAPAAAAAFAIGAALTAAPVGSGTSAAAPSVVATLTATRQPTVVAAAAFTPSAGLTTSAAPAVAAPAGFTPRATLAATGSSTSAAASSRVFAGRAPVTRVCAGAARVAAVYVGTIKVYP